MDRTALRSSSAHVIVEATQLAADRVLLDDATAHHLVRVCRLRGGESVTATDGAGRWRRARLERAGDPILVADGPIETDLRTSEVTICAAIPKGDRLDWMVQKLSELGVARLRLLECERSVVRWKPERVSRQLDRVSRVADEALRQSRGTHRLRVEPPVPAVDVLCTAAVAEPGGGAIEFGDRTVAIGPEGGWSDTERGTISRSVDLGANILRIETAAIVAATLCVVAGH